MSIILDLVLNIIILLGGGEGYYDHLGLLHTMAEGWEAIDFLQSNC